MEPCAYGVHEADGIAKETGSAKECHRVRLELLLVVALKLLGYVRKISIDVADFEGIHFERHVVE